MGGSWRAPSLELHFNDAKSLEREKVTATHLVFHVMLHIHVTTFQNLQAEGTQQLFWVFMDCPEVSLHIWEEGGSVIADLWNEWNKEFEWVLSFFRKQMKEWMNEISKDGKELHHESEWKYRPGTHKASPLVCGIPSCVPKELARMQMQVHRSYKWLKS